MILYEKKNLFVLKDTTDTSNGINDEILSNSGDFLVSEKEVEECFVKESYELINIEVGGEVIKTTPDHPFYAPKKGFTKAINLRAGDELCTVNGEYVIIERIQHEILESPVKVYNFRVADYHTYFVGESGIATHNTTCNTGTNGSTEVKQSEKYEPTQELRDHIKSGNGQAPKGSKGIDGAHNEVEFKKMVEKHRCKIIDVTEIEPGIKKYDYQVPCKDITGKVVEGEYKTKIQHKTTYDPEIISDDTFIVRGMEAFKNYKNNLKANELVQREWISNDDLGLEWRGYTDGYGNLTSFFPNY